MHLIDFSYYLSYYFKVGGIKSSWFSYFKRLIGRRFNQPVNKLPATLTHLTTGINFNQHVNHFNEPVDALPSTLTHLTTGDCFNQPVDKLPPKLTHLNWI
jgi:hypothetical protein